MYNQPGYVSGHQPVEYDTVRLKSLRTLEHPLGFPVEIPRESHEFARALIEHASREGIIGDYVDRDASLANADVIRLLFELNIRWLGKSKIKDIITLRLGLHGLEGILARGDASSGEVGERIAELQKVLG